MLLGENISLKMTWAYSWWMDTRSFPVSLDYVECTWGTSTKETESGGQMSVILRTTADLWHIRLVVYESFKSHLLSLFKKQKKQHWFLAVSKDGYQSHMMRCPPEPSILRSNFIWWCLGQAQMLTVHAGVQLQALRASCPIWPSNGSTMGSTEKFHGTVETLLAASYPFAHWAEVPWAPLSMKYRLIECCFNSRIPRWTCLGSVNAQLAFHSVKILPGSSKNTTAVSLWRWTPESWALMWSF